jgi:hypothetical protein
MDYERAQPRRRRGARGDLSAEVVFLDGEDKVTCYYAHYGLP